jgi:hypothetical protein
VSGPYQCVGSESEEDPESSEAIGPGNPQLMWLELGPVAGLPSEASKDDGWSELVCSRVSSRGLGGETKPGRRPVKDCVGERSNGLRPRADTELVAPFRILVGGEL